MSIPVIGTAVVNSVYWVNRLYGSIDYPVDNFVIVNNNGRGQLDDELRSLKSIKHKFVKKVSIIDLPANIGAGGAYNLIIKCFMMSPYWIFVNDDVAFGPGLLNEMVINAEADTDIGMIHANAGDVGMGSWDLFLIRDHIIQNFGLFDESMYPAYCEDADYMMRFMHRPIKRIVSLEGMYYHGHGTKTQYYAEGSQTQKTEPELKEKLDFCNDKNIEYLTRKWGPGWRVCNPDEVPYKDQPASVSSTFYDLYFNRQKHLGF